MIPGLKIYFNQKQKEMILKSVEDILDKGQLSAGEYVKSFEEKWSEICNTKFACAVSSGGAALEVIMKSLDLKNKEVIVPSNTFLATSNAVHVAGANPILSDVNLEDMNLDLENIKKNFSEKTKAVCIVHVGGIITKEIEKIKNFCDDNKVYLIEDAAHGHGSTFNSKYAGNFGIAGAYSFTATKTFTSGEGGMIVCNDENLDLKFRKFRDYGKKSQWESFHTVLSSNYRMSNVTAAVGLGHISEYKNFLKRREEIADLYTKELSEKFTKILPEKNSSSSWYKYTVFLPKNINKDKFKSKMKDLGVGIPGGVYDLPLHLQPVYEHLNLTGKLKNSEYVCRQHICLPIYPSLKIEEQKKVITILNKSINEV